MTLDITKFSDELVASGDGFQARYLVHNHEDVLWTDSLDDALDFLRYSLNEIEGILYEN